MLCDVCGDNAAMMDTSLYSNWCKACALNCEVLEGEMAGLWEASKAIGELIEAKLVQLQPYRRLL
jgi:hypothetical protein